MDTIYSGPHIGIANPLFKASRRLCRINSDYDNIDLTRIDDKHLQRVNYSPACAMEEYLRGVPSTHWGEKYTNIYRIASRKMLSLTGERTLISAIIPPQTGHINGLFGSPFKTHDYLWFCRFLCIDCVRLLIKVMGKSNLYDDNAGNFLLDETHVADYISHRSLLLNCLTRHYQELWKEFMMMR